MNAVLIYSSATVLGASTGAITGTGVYLRLVARLKRRDDREATARDLEKRRDIALSGRTDELRKHAGSPANLGSLFPIARLGALAQRKMDKDVDAEQNRG